MAACIDFGWWQRADGRREVLTWWQDGVVTLDGPGGVELLGYIPSEQIARAAFEGWAEHCDYPCSAGWVRERVAEAARSCAHRTPACPDCAVAVLR